MTNPVRLTVYFVMAFTAYRTNAQAFDAAALIDTEGPAARVAVSCAGGCPPALAYVQSYHERPLSTEDLEHAKSCLGTLISPTEVLTNAHCTPPTELLPLMRVRFPGAAGFAEEKVRVTRVVRRAPWDTSPLEDYAVLELSRPVGRPVAVVRRSNLRPGQMMFVYAPEVTGSDDQGWDQVTLKPRACAADHEERRERAGTQNIMLRLRGCRAISGSSGGPILDHAGRIAGIVWGGADDHINGVNIACVPGLNPLGRRAHACTQTIGLVMSRIGHKNLAPGVAQLNPYVLIRGDAALIDERALIYMRPVCAVRRPDGPVTITTNVISFKKIGDDEEWVPVGTPLPYALPRAKYTLAPASGKGTEVAITIDGYDRAILPFTVPPCGTSGPRSIRKRK